MAGKLKTVIFGAGGFAREVLPFVRLCKGYEVLRFVDVDPAGDKIDGVAVMAEKDFWVKYKKLGIRGAVVAVGEPAVREKIFGDSICYVFKIFCGIEKPFIYCLTMFIKTAAINVKFDNGFRS